MDRILRRARARPRALLAALFPVLVALSHPPMATASEMIAALMGGSASPGDLLREDAAPGSHPIVSDLEQKNYDRALEAAARMAEDNPKDPEGFNLMGGAYVGKNDLVNARKSYEAALRVRPDYVPALLNLAQLDLREKDSASAAKRYGAILAKDSSNAAAMEGMAQVEAFNGNDKEVLGWLERRRERQPRALPPAMALARYHYARKDYLNALAALNAALPEHAQDPALLELRGQVELAAARQPAAVKTFAALVSVRPSPLAHFELASAQAAAGDARAAEASLRNALKLKGDFVEAAVALAELYLRDGRAAEALKVARELQMTAPASPNGQVLEGDILMAQQRYADAAKSYSKALAMKQSGMLAAKVHSARSRSGDPVAADAELHQWLQTHPQDFRARRYLAADYARRGATRAAIDEYQLVIKADPKDFVALNNLASLYQEQKDPRALEIAEAAYKIQPQSALVADTLGWILVQQGTTGRGLEVLRSAVAIDPKNAEIRYHWAAALAKSGDRDQARAELENLLNSKQEFPQRQAAQMLLKQL